jgi:3-oxoacyl-[acyl-carrier-protein] synthase-3
MPTDARVRMRTDAHGVLENGLGLARETYGLFRRELSIPEGKPDKFICHQVGSTHQQLFHKTIGIDGTRDFATFPFLGNMGTVSLPMTAAIAEERGFLVKGDWVGFLGIGSGLNCLMMGILW